MRNLIIGLFLSLLCINSSYANSKTKCNTQVNYDIYITKQNIKIIDNRQNILVTSEGNITIDGIELPLSEATKQKAIQFQKNVRNKLPQIEKQTYWHLNDLRTHFENAINQKIGKKSSLLKHLDNIYAKLKQLMKSAINTENNVTEFHHQVFNKITDEGEKIAKKEMGGILRDSIVEFKLFKNIATLKGIAKKEWKQKKGDLKTFNEQVCVIVEALDKEKTLLINEARSQKWLNAGQ